MTRLERLQSMTKKELEEFFCDLWLMSTGNGEPLEFAEGCTICPMRDHCSHGHSGWGYFLDGEFDERYTTGM